MLILEKLYHDSPVKFCIKALSSMKHLKRETNLDFTSRFKLVSKNKIISTDKSSLTEKSNNTYRWIIIRNSGLYCLSTINIVGPLLNNLSFWLKLVASHGMSAYLRSWFQESLFFYSHLFIYNSSLWFAYLHVGMELHNVHTTS